MNRLKRLEAFLHGAAPDSALLCSVEGDPSSDGGAPAAPVTPPAPNGTPTITPDVQALIEQARADERTKTSNSVWKQAREKYEKGNGGGQQPQPPKQNDQPAPQPQTVDVRAEINRIRSFERAVGQYGLEADAIAMLEEDLNAANPSDPADWVHKRAKAFGWKASGGTSTPATPATPAAMAAPQITPKGAPVTGGGAPSNPTTITDDTPILRMSNSDQLALRQRIGDVAFVDRMRKEFRNTRVRFK